MWTSVSLLITVGILLSCQFPVQAGPASDKGEHWSYDDYHGPSHWCKIDPHGQCCGKLQSPIDIDELEAKLEFFKPLEFINYTHVPKEMTLSNNGHTIVLTFGPNDYAPGVKSGGLSDYFIFDSLHFHWGKDNSWGSEHTIGGRRYPLEMHLVHYNSKYSNKNKAAIMPDGLAVVGILFHLSEKDNPRVQGVIKGLNDVRYSNDSVQISEPFGLSDILPLRTDDFFRYTGSLTTPPCSEVVTWTVLDSTVGISEYQMSRFRTLRVKSKMDLHPDDDMLVDNFRPTQSLYGRRVHARSTLAKYQAITHESAASKDGPRAFVLLANAVAVLLYFSTRTSAC